MWEVQGVVRDKTGDAIEPITLRGHQWEDLTRAMVRHEVYWAKSEAMIDWVELREISRHEPIEALSLLLDKWRKVFAELPDDSIPDDPGPVPE